MEDPFVKNAVDKVKVFYQKNPQIQQSHGIDHALDVFRHACHALEECNQRSSSSAAADVDVNDVTLAMPFVDDDEDSSTRIPVAVSIEEARDILKNTQNSVENSIHYTDEIKTKIYSAASIGDEMNKSTKNKQEPNIATKEKPHLSVKNEEKNDTLIVTRFVKEAMVDTDETNRETASSTEDDVREHLKNTQESNTSANKERECQDQEIKEFSTHNKYDAKETIQNKQETMIFTKEERKHQDQEFKELPMLNTPPIKDCAKETMGNAQEPRSLAKEENESKDKESEELSRLHRKQIEYDTSENTKPNIFAKKDNEHRYHEFKELSKLQTTQTIVEKNKSENLVEALAECNSKLSVVVTPPVPAMVEEPDHGDDMTEDNSEYWAFHTLEAPKGNNLLS